MIPRQIGEHGGVVPDARHPILRQTVRRHFHRSRPATRIDHPAKQAVQIVRLRRGIIRHLAFCAESMFDGPDQSRRQPRRVEHGVNEIRGRRLAIRTRHPDQLQRIARATVKPAGDMRECAVRVLRLHKRRVSRVGLAFGNDGFGARSNRLRNKGVPVRKIHIAAEGDKHIAFSHAPRMRCNAPDIGIASAGAMRDIDQ